ncbi:DUF2637 domain-containing protein [Streptomyces lavendulae]|uniref:DUF2637 domain-containing protein n=1 Tax=Streptomyces lavendulae TaxID=1914 RepID=UPI0031F055DC
MNETLMPSQTTGQGEALAPAAPATAGATPGPRPGAPVRPEGTPAPPRLGGQGRPGPTGQGVSTAGATAPVDPATVADPPAGPAGASRVSKVLAVAALIGMIPVAVIGFAASYTTVADKAAAAGFAAWLAPWIPIGLDGAIIGFLALDLYMTRRRTPWPLLRFAAHGMTAATVAINAASGAAVAVATEGAAAAEVLPAPVRVFWHGLMPILFVVGVEAARRLIVHATQLEDGTAIDRIPLHRWALSPWKTPRLYREMRLANIRSYPEMVERKRELEGYKVWLKQELGGDLSKATDEQRLPMTMAGQGFTVEEALALPAKWRAEAEQRAKQQQQEAAAKQQAEAEERRAEAERRDAEAERERLRKKAAAVAALTDNTDVEVIKLEQAARAGTAAAKAEAARAAAESEAAAAKAAAEHRRTAAERLAQTEAEALESRDAAAARLKAAEDSERAERAAAEAQRQRAEKEKAAAEAQKWAAEAERQAAAVERAEAEKAAAAAQKAEAEKAEAAARYEASLIEARAQQAEDYARLSPRERSERLVARMLLAAGVDPAQAERQIEAVPLAQVMQALNIKQTAAGDIRKAAALLLESGYQPLTLEAALDTAWEEAGV